ncbi:MAG: Sapep family Mn(2+)-dependent dipeptidase [Clostridia bacterium]|nr:Sapep family Mn(2+)-dependent dipeptidase [Clostridia bacterium]
MSDISELVRIPSVLSEPEEGCPYGRPCYEAMAAALRIGEKYGLHAREYDSAVGCLTLREGPADLGIWAHSDVVPVSGGWTYPPFEPVLIDGKLYGRGSTDNKGQLVATMYAIRCLKELGVTLRNNPGLFVGTKEETGMEDVKGWVKTHEEPKFSLVPDASYTIGYAEKGSLKVSLTASLEQKGLLSLKGGTAINVFPEKIEVVFARDQLCWDRLNRLEKCQCEEGPDGSLRLIVTGKGGHAAHTRGENNPFAIMIRDICQAEILKEGPSPLLRFIADVCADETGKALGIDCCDEITKALHLTGTLLSFDGSEIRLSLNVRYPLGVTPEELKEKIERTCAPYGMRADILASSAPSYSDPNEAGAVAAAAVHNELAPLYGYEPKGNYTLGGGTYAKHLKRGYAFGMDAGANAHGVDEYVRIDRLLFGGMVYAMCLLKLDEIY